MTSPQETKNNSYVAYQGFNDMGISHAYEQKLDEIKLPSDPTLFKNEQLDGYMKDILTEHRDLSKSQDSYQELTKKDLEKNYFKKYSYLRMGQDLKEQDRQDRETFVAWRSKTQREGGKERRLLAFEHSQLTENICAVMELQMLHKQDLEGESLIKNEDQFCTKMGEVLFGEQGYSCPKAFCLKTIKDQEMNIDKSLIRMENEEDQNNFKDKLMSDTLKSQRMEAKQINASHLFYEYNGQKEIDDNVLKIQLLTQFQGTEEIIAKKIDKKRYDVIEQLVILGGHADFTSIKKELNYENEMESTVQNIKDEQETIVDIQDICKKDDSFQSKDCFLYKKLKDKIINVCKDKDSWQADLMKDGYPEINTYIIRQQIEMSRILKMNSPLNSMAQERLCCIEMQLETLSMKDSHTFFKMGVQSIRKLVNRLEREDIILSQNKVKNQVDEQNKMGGINSLENWIKKQDDEIISKSDKNMLKKKEIIEKHEKTIEENKNTKQTQIQLRERIQKAKQTGRNLEFMFE